MIFEEKLWLGTLIGAALLIVPGAFLHTVCDPASFSATRETFGTCSREWIGSLSGWAAVIAAFLTVRAIYAQITAHREEQHRHAHEVRKIAEERLRAVLKEINRAWKLCEDISANRDTLDTNAPVRESPHYKAFLAAYQIVCFCIARQDRQEICDLADDMLPLDKARFKYLCSALERLKTTVPYSWAELPDPQFNDPDFPPFWDSWVHTVTYHLGAIGDLVRAQFPEMYPII
ncbi:MAG: hypothetical protein JJ902_23570, partial [Roseibium sp.]|nr:hypothetical protein [Roseibium sp.]